MSKKNRDYKLRPKRMKHNCPEGWVFVSKDGKILECATCGEKAYV